MNRKIMDVSGTDIVFKYNPTEKINPKDFPRPYKFLVKEEIGTGFREVLYAHNMRNFQTIDEEKKVFVKQYSEFEKSENIDNKKYQLIIINVSNRGQLAVEGITQKQIADWIKKLSIPEK